MTVHGPRSRWIRPSLSQVDTEAGIEVELEEINAYTSEPHKMAETYSELHQNIQDKFNEAGVEIMSPHYSQLRDGNDATILASNRPPYCRPAAFRVQQVREDPQHDDEGSS